MINPALNRCFPLFWCTMMVQLLCIARTNGQTVIGGDTVDQSAILDIQDTAKGVLLTRLTTDQRNAIIKPAFGLLILNTTRQCLEANIGSPIMPEWRCLTTGIPKISQIDTAYWNRKLGAGDTLQLSERITKVGLPQFGNTYGNLLYWDGTSWVRLASGQNGQFLQLRNGLPTWSGAAFPNVITGQVASVTSFSATADGNILFDGGGEITARGIVYGTNSNPTIKNNVIQAGKGTGSFSVALTGLGENLTYYIRAYAINSAGVEYGNEVSFTTLPSGKISVISCSESTTNGDLINGKVSAGISTSIPYDGGNGGYITSQSFSSQGVSGLTATIGSGTLNSGTGNLIFNVSGTPIGIGAAIFDLQIDNQRCTLILNVIAGGVDSITCSNELNTGILIERVASSQTSINIIYSGGNGGSFAEVSVNSSGVQGLSAKINPGNFAVGSGSLTFNLSGTPASSGVANFVINIGGKSCSVNVEVLPGQISSINCTGAISSGNIIFGLANPGISLSIPYLGGNGGGYNEKSILSTGVTGLTAQINKGNFAFGNGSLTLSVNGTPLSSGTATFALEIAGKSCSLNLEVIPGRISSIDCQTSILNGSLITGIAATEVTAVIGYSGGNGGSYDGQIVASTGVTGLFATLHPGKFLVGNGSLTFSITGIPDQNGVANFLINIGNQICNLVAVIEGPIGGITCNTASTGALVAGIAATGVTFTNSYTGGNGGKFNGRMIPSNGVSGLTATLQGGTLKNGDSTLVYTVTGTPATTGTATFLIEIGGQSCVVNLTVVAGLVSSLGNCGTVTLTNGPLTIGSSAIGKSFTINYSGGNGGSHTGQVVGATGVSGGLTAVLSAGNFANGSGTLVYTLSGTPTSSGTASFAINIGGRTCVVFFNVSV